MANVKALQTPASQSALHAPAQVSQRARVWKNIRKNQLYYLLMLPGILYFIIFHYIPMFGIIVAFKDISPYEGVAGIINGPWVGLKHFIRFFNSYYFWNVLGNTLTISGYRLIFGFPAPIILALLLNEVRHNFFKRTVQTISYLPHFISLVVLTGLVTSVLTTQGGLVNGIIQSFGGETINFLGDPKYFRSILVISGIWQQVGWGSILYLAAMANIDPTLYEAATMDGAGRLAQVWYITLPSIAFVIAILFILAVGNLLNAGFEQILLLYSPSVYKVADIIDTYVYREGLINLQYSFASAVGLFKSVLAFVLLVSANKLAHKMDQPGIW